MENPNPSVSSSKGLLAVSSGRFLQPYDAGILDIFRANYGAGQNEVKHENGPFWQSGKMAYHCPRCNAGYTYKKTLKTHMKYDCGKEPRFKCPYCNKRDKCSSNIYKHIRMRHDGNPVYVDKLDRGFTLKKNMTRHLRHECGMAPKYQCPYCDKPSKFTQNIYAHIRKYHPGQALCFRRLY
ncbi:hypothetical protein DMN91_012841 [Ooceraea biroi]|uniref:C2H2-type domain-containing protein n=1 Tax=Ooceraea biroi TaxID=2015173 RepID=A0A3L8D406_OOCBI|nr:hypothetical protein DMN91_012841 [Ooceraea biroi]